MLKIFSQQPSATEPEQYTFTFTSPHGARAEADAIKDALSLRIQAAKAASGPLAIGAAGAGGTSAAMAIANAVPSSGPRGAEPWWDYGRLLADLELQHSLLKSDAALGKTFMEALLTTKNGPTSDSQLGQRFWSTRLHLLRAHAIERSQKKGSYNVLSTIKPKQEGEKMRLNLSPEQVRIIFDQHPIVRRAYDENVPRIENVRFWSRFFVSRLFKKLKGEKVVEQDARDQDFDKYLAFDDDSKFLTTGRICCQTNDLVSCDHSYQKGRQQHATGTPLSRPRGQ